LANDHDSYRDEGVMQLAIDLYSDGQGAWSLEAFDLPDITKRSARFPDQSADLVIGPQPDPAESTRIVLTEALLTPLADQAINGSLPTLYVYVFRPRDRAAVLDFERRIHPRYHQYYADLGVFYAGIFDTSSLGGPHLAEILAFDRSLAAAQEFVSDFEPAEDITKIENQCRLHQDRDQPRHLLWLYR
jgi:hypothetical protein